MRKTARILLAWAGVALSGGLAPGALADEIRVAVAANFGEAMQALAAVFAERSGVRVTPIAGSTGKHYAQIVNGAPFDAFYAADARHPALLESAGRIVPGSRFSYAVGRVVLWSPVPGYVDAAGAVLRAGGFRRLALANPRLAPYGAAAREVLEALGLWEALQGRIVRGENISQAFHYVASGNAELGFVAYSQVVRLPAAQRGSWWAPPAALYRPLEQQAVSLSDRPAVRVFQEFVRGDEGRAIIASFGYAVP